MHKHTKEAFVWIIKILRKHKVPYRLSGGFAARVYGSKRPLADIEMPDKYFPVIYPDIKKYLFFGPANYKDKNFDTFGIGIRYKGQNIEISGSDSEKLYDSKKKKWIKSRINIKNITKKKVYGLSVKIIAKEDLIKYKERLSRPVDKKDLLVLKGK